MLFYTGGDIAPPPIPPTSTQTPITANDSIFDDTQLPNTFFDYCIKAYENITVVLWRFAEIHCPKFVCLVVMMVALQQV